MAICLGPAWIEFVSVYNPSASENCECPPPAPRPRRAGTHARALRAILANMNKEQPDDSAKEQFDQLTAYRERLRARTTPEVINRSVERAIQDLKEIFGVDNLSDLELASLRRETIAVADVLGDTVHFEIEANFHIFSLMPIPEYLQIFSFGT